jgi:O-antigen/teichoic acid export membrane protein
MSYAINQYPSFIFDNSKTFLFIYFIISLLNFAISIPFYSYYSLGKYFFVGIFISQALSFLLLYFGYLNGNLQFELYAVVRIFQSFLPVLLLAIIYLASTEISAMEYLWILLFIYLVIPLSAIFRNLLKSSLPIRKGMEIPDQVSIFVNFGKNSYLVQLYRSLHLNLDFMILGFVVSPTSVSEYAIALTLAMTPQLYLASKQVSAQSDARDASSREKTRRKAQNTIIKNIYISVTLLLAETVLFLSFHRYVFKEDISHVLLLVAILAPAYMIDGCGAYVGNLLIGLGDNREYASIQLRGFILNLTLLSFGIGFLGMVGAAIASLISYSYLLFLSLRVLDVIKSKK